MQKSIEHSWTNCLEQLEVKKDIVFYGDSIMHLGYWQKWFPDVEICNLGLGGDAPKGGLRRLAMLLTLSPKKIFLEFGINWTQCPLNVFENDYVELIKAIQNQLPNAMIYVFSILPIHHSRFEEYASNDVIMQKNEVLKQISKRYGLTYIDLYTKFVDKNQEMPYELTRDGLHPNKNGYEIIVANINKYVYE